MERAADAATVNVEREIIEAAGRYLDDPAGQGYAAQHDRPIKIAEPSRANAEEDARRCREHDRLASWIRQTAS